MLDLLSKSFTLTVEVVPPEGKDAEGLLSTLEFVCSLPFDGFSVATNPVAKPRLSALALAGTLQTRTGKPVILHCTTRDHNRLGLQALLWGAWHLGLRTLLAATGDFVAFHEQGNTTTVRDIDVLELIKKAREVGFATGVVLDPAAQPGGLPAGVERLKAKIAAGAQFAVTQPLYSTGEAKSLADLTDSLAVPIILGILPLRTAGHADFLHEKVSGITIPDSLRRQLHESDDPLAVGLDNARQLLETARSLFAGACVMPPFDHYEILPEIL